MSKHRRNATSLSASRKKQRPQRDEQEDKVEDYFESTPKMHDKRKISNVDLNLTLPEIRRSSPTKRANSAAGIDRFAMTTAQFSDFTLTMKTNNQEEEGD